MIYTRTTHAQLKAKLQTMDSAEETPPIVLISGDVLTAQRKNVAENKMEDVVLDYEDQRFGFNRRFNIRPAAIVFCTNEKQVQHVLKVAKAHPEFPLRAKSTGHDHESESTGTDAIVIDFYLMNDFSLDHEKGTATIHSGHCV